MRPRTRRLVGCSVLSLGIALGSTAASAGPSGGASAPATGRPGFLFGVAAVGGSRAWAVGQAGVGIAPRLLRRTPTGWRPLPAPPGGGQAELQAVGAVAPGVVWAVGDTGAKTYTARWRDGRWRSVPSPSFGLDDTLEAVSGSSRTDVWAVGSHLDSGEENSRTLAVHWDGSSWRAVATPNPFDFPVLAGVAALSPRNAWAVGSTGLGALVLHWNGSDWQRSAAPSGGDSGELSAVAVAARDDVWAVGDTGRAPLALHRVGTSWRRVALPTDGRAGALYGIDAVSARDVWAVGRARRPHAGSTVPAPLFLHWDGARWHLVPSPNPRLDTTLTAVSADSSSSVWAVGYSGDGANARAVVMHWDGARWSVE